MPKAEIFYDAESIFRVGFSNRIHTCQCVGFKQKIIGIAAAPKKRFLVPRSFLKSGKNALKTTMRRRRYCYEKAVFDSSFHEK